MWAQGQMFDVVKALEEVKADKSLNPVEFLSYEYSTRSTNMLLCVSLWMQHSALLRVDCSSPGIVLECF